MHEHGHEHEGGQGFHGVNPIQVQKYLGGLDYPVDKKTLLDKARDAGAPQDVLDTLNHLPDTQFNKPTDISEQIGKLT